MAITCEEKYDSRTMIDGQSAELTFVIRGTSDEVAALFALDAATSSTFHSMIRQPLEIEPIHIDEDNDDDCIWNGKAKYVPYIHEDDPETGESSFSFDTGGGTQHITQSLETVASYGLDGTTPPDFKGAINVTQDSVEGCDITVPVFNFSETHYISDDALDRHALFLLTGKKNTATFREFAAAECLFLGASGSKRGRHSDWEVFFKFAASLNRTNITVGEITGISKRGWDYLWTRYADSEDPVAHVTVKKPIGVYIEKVYEDGDLGDLGIGS